MLGEYGGHGPTKEEPSAGCWLARVEWLYFGLETKVLVLDFKEQQRQT